MNYIKFAHFAFKVIISAAVIIFGAWICYNIIANAPDLVSAAKAHENAWNAFCQNGTVMRGRTVDYCDGHPFKCQGTYCTYITGMAEDTWTCGPKGQQCTEEIPIG